MIQCARLRRSVRSWRVATVAKRASLRRSMHHARAGRTGNKLVLLLRHRRPQSELLEGVWKAAVWVIAVTAMAMVVAVVGTGVVLVLRLATRLLPHSKTQPRE